MKTMATVLTTLFSITAVGLGANEGTGVAPASGHIADYPCFGGIDGSFAGGPVSESMVTNWRNGTLVWESEERRLPSSYGAIMGGAGGPVVADGRVYVYYSFPSVNGSMNTNIYERGVKDGKVILTGDTLKLFHRMATAMNVDVVTMVEYKAKIRSDDIVLCCDLKTGKTIWKKVYEGNAINRSFCGRGIDKSNKCGPHIIPAVAYGKVCSLLDRGGIVCLDPASGKEVWRLDGPANNKDSETVVEGVMLFGGGNFITMRNWKLAAYRATDGKKMWEGGAVSGGQYAGAVRTTLFGLDLVISNAGFVLDAATGKTLYTVQGASGYFPTLAGDILLMPGGSNKGKDGAMTYAGVSAYRLYPDRFEKLWQLAGKEEYVAKGLTRVVMKGYYFFRGENNFSCVDVATGKDIKHSRNFRTDGMGGTIGIGGQRLVFDKWLFIADNGKVELDPTSRGAGDGNDQDPDWTSSHTGCAVGPYLIARTQNSLKCWDLRAK